MLTTSRTTSTSFWQVLYPWIIVMGGMLFYCYNYFLRTSPSVMQTELVNAFHINAYQFGALAAFYYYAYTAMQIPAGMIYDKFGVRFVLSSACLLATCGLAVFINANDFLVAGIGRFMIGLGCAFAYIGILKLASVWLPTNRFATIAGLSNAVGMASGALAQNYLTPTVALIGYKAALHSAVMVGVGLCCFMVLLLRNKPKSALYPTIEPHQPMNLRQLSHALWLICRNPQMWIIGLIGCLFYLPSSVFQDLWGIPYLKNVYHLTGTQAAATSSYLFYGWIISGPVIGMLSDKIRRRRLPIMICGIAAIALWCLVFYTSHLSLSSLPLIFFAIGFSCGAQPLCFALGKENNPVQISATSVAITNMLIMLGGVIFQPVVGALLDMHANNAGNLINHYTPSDYTFALSVLPIGVAVGVVLSFFLKETYCESQVAEERPVFKGTPVLTVVEKATL